MTTKARPIYNNFNAGEISPLMVGRVDFPRFQNGVETLENWILHVQGGVSRRWGMRYIGEVKTSAKKTRLIPFEFGGDQYILIEMGHQYIRFWKNGAPIMEPTTELITNGTFDTDISNWTDVGGPYTNPPTWNSALKAMKLNGAIGTPPNDNIKSQGYQAFTTEIGKTYSVSWTGDAYHSLMIGTTAGGQEVKGVVGNAGANSTTFVATSTTTYITLSSSWWVTNVDDISVMDATGTVLEIATTYTEGDLFEIQYVQSNDIIYFAHRNYPIRKLARLAATNDSWDFKVATFLPPPSFEKEVYPNITLTPVQTSGAGITFYGSDDFFLAADKDKMIQIGDSRAVITAVDAGKILVTADIIDAWASSYHVAGGTGNLSSSGTTVTVTGHGLTSANIGDVILLTSGPQSGEVRRIDAVPGVDTITIDTAFTADQSSVDWERCVHMDAKAWKLIGSPSAKLTVDKKAPARAIITLTLDAAGWRQEDATKGWDFTDVGKYVKAMGGLIKITEYTSDTVVKGQLLTALSSAPTTAPFETLAGTWTLEEESWIAANGYPSAVCFYEQRLFFGGTNTHPQTIWGSVTNDYENFAAGTKATDSVEYTIATNDINPIRWLASARVLLIGTSAREFRASGGSDPISPTNIDIRAETSYGSPKRRPVSIGHTTIFVQRAKRRLREMAYSFEADAYEAPDLTVISPHISEAGIEEVAYCPEPHAILYAIRGDGQLLALTYEKDQDVYGWGRIITDGLYESIAILPPVTGSDEYQVYVIVNRTIDGSTKRYIERLDSAAHTDCAMIGAGPITTVTGLTHLEGKTVKMKGDGALYPDAVVASGQVSFPESVNAYEIGLPYISTLVTHRPELATKEGSIQGKPKGWSSLYVRCIDLIGLKINGDQIGTRDPSDLLGEAVDPETGDFRADTLGIDSDAKITIMQDLPFPATVVMIAGELTVGD
jgi:hypothetical protein